MRTRLKASNYKIFTVAVMITDVARSTLWGAPFASAAGPPHLQLA